MELEKITMKIDRGLKASAMALVSGVAPLALYEWAKHDYEVLRTIGGLSLMAIGAAGVYLAAVWYDRGKKH